MLGKHKAPLLVLPRSALTVKKKKKGMQKGQLGHKKIEQYREPE